MSPAPAAGICVRDLTKRYDAVEALRGVSLDVAPGEIFGLLGPNGAGKTTAIECLLGLRRPDAGSALLDGVDALAQPAAARRRVGAQLQVAALQDKITPREALGLFAAFEPEAADVGGLLEKFSLEAKANASFDSLSAGQRQRLFLALAFVNPPRLLFLDEPTAGLDPQARRALHRRIVEAKAAGCAVLLSTHYLEEAEQLCDRVGILHEGRLIASSRASPRVAFRTARPVDAAALALPGMVSCERLGDGWQIVTRDVNRTISSLAQQLGESGNEMLDLRFHRPSLEDVFLELTGCAWSAEQPEAPA